MSGRAIAVPSTKGVQTVGHVALHAMLSLPDLNLPCQPGEPRSSSVPARTKRSLPFLNQNLIQV